MKRERGENDWMAAYIELQSRPPLLQRLGAQVSHFEAWDVKLKQRRKPRKLSLVSAIKAVRKAGVDKGTVTVDGVSVSFGESESTAAVNPWLADLDTVTKQ